MYTILVFCKRNQKFNTTFQSKSKGKGQIWGFNFKHDRKTDGQNNV